MDTLVRLACLRHVGKKKEIKENGAGRKRSPPEREEITKYRKK